MPERFRGELLTMGRYTKLHLPLRVAGESAVKRKK